MERRPATHGLLDHRCGATLRSRLTRLAERPPALRVGRRAEGLLRRTAPWTSLTSIRALRVDAVAAFEYFQRVADRYAAGEGATPAIRLSALVARLLSEKQAATTRWAAWAEPARLRVGIRRRGGRRVGCEDAAPPGEEFPLSEDPGARGHASARFGAGSRGDPGAHRREFRPRGSASPPPRRSNPAISRAFAKGSSRGQDLNHCDLRGSRFCVNPRWAGLPPLAVEITKHRLDSVRCPACGRSVRASPRRRSRGCFGPKLEAAIASPSAARSRSARSTRSSAAPRRRPAWVRRLWPLGVLQRPRARVAAGLLVAPAARLHLPRRPQPRLAGRRSGSTDSRSPGTSSTPGSNFAWYAKRQADDARASEARASRSKLSRRRCQSPWPRWSSPSGRRSSAHERRRRGSGRVPTTGLTN